MPDMDSTYRNRLAEQLIERPQAFIAQELASQVSDESIPVHYAYSDVVVQNDNFLMVSAYTDRYQTAKGCKVENHQRCPGGPGRRP